MERCDGYGGMCYVAICNINILVLLYIFKSMLLLDSLLVYTYVEGAPLWLLPLCNNNTTIPLACREQDQRGLYDSPVVTTLQYNKLHFNTYGYSSLIIISTNSRYNTGGKPLRFVTSTYGYL